MTTDGAARLTFDDFVHENLTDCIRRCEEDQNGLLPIVVVESDLDQLLLEADEEETNGQYLERAREVARSVDARRIFIGMVGPATLIEEAEALMWFAHSKFKGVDEVRQGLVTLHHGRCGAVWEGRPDGASQLFCGVLGDDNQ